jgi:hypothetical protein
VGGVAEDDAAALWESVRGAFEGYQGEVRICGELGVEGGRGDEVGGDAREVVLEEGEDGGFV